MTSGPMIWALDVSKTCTGIAQGRVGEQPRASSIRTASGADDATAMAKLGRWMMDAIKADRPDFVFYEAALNVIPGKWDAESRRVKPSGNPRTTIALAKMVGIVEFVCQIRNVPIRTAHVQTVRARFLGNGRPENPKQRAQAMCRVLGWGEVNQDEADALAVWWHACTLIAPRAYQVITQMMQAKAATEAAGTVSTRRAARLKAAS